MMNLKEIFKHYTDDLGEGADCRKRRREENNAT